MLICSNLVSLGDIGNYVGADVKVKRPLLSYGGGVAEMLCHCKIRSIQRPLLLLVLYARNFPDHVLMTVNILVVMNCIRLSTLQNVFFSFLDWFRTDPKKERE